MEKSPKNFSVILHYPSEASKSKNSTIKLAFNLFRNYFLESTYRAFYCNTSEKEETRIFIVLQNPLPQAKCKKIIKLIKIINR